MTNQELFTKVWTGLAAHGFERSEGSMVGCAYRGDEGRRCAAGHLIADAHYQAEMEGESVDSWKVKAALIGSGVTEDQLGLVEELQCAHDNAVFAADVRAALQSVAADYGFAVPNV